MLVAISIMLYGTAFILGFIVGRFNINSQSNHNTSFLNSSSSVVPKKQIKIDEQKFITAVDTRSFEKKGKSLGNKTVVNDNLDSAVLKLSQLKKR
jgi:translation initiation factor 6 (eIF-6)